MSWWIGLGGSVIIASLAYSRRSLSISGMIAAIVLGTWMYGISSLVWYGVLIYFFVSATIWSKFKQASKVKAETGYEKTGRRDAWQVAANGGLGLLLCILYYGWPHELWLIAFLGVMATVTADTWATELGGLSRTLPWSIRTGKRVVAGTSGGVSILGLSASLCGAASVGLIAIGFSWIEGEAASGVWVLATAVGGTFGALIDSWMGASWQRMNRCSVCEQEVEGPVHCEGKRTMHSRGFIFLNNDTVNFISSVLGGLMAVGIYIICV